MVEQSGPAGPPQWGSSHWYRRSYGYYYYPGADVYYRPDNRMWFYLDRGNWRMVAQLPTGIRVDFGRSVSLKLDSDRPYTYHQKVVSYYPSNYFAKVKFKNDRDNRRDDRNDRRDDHNDRNDRDDHGKSDQSAARTAHITSALTRTLRAAQSSVLLQSPYLVLSPSARELFRDLRRKNSAMRLCVSTNSFASTDNLLAYSANYRLRSAYIDDLQLEIHEFKPLPAALPELFPRHELMARLAHEGQQAGQPARAPFLCLHAKSLVVDDTVAFIGSYNLDPRSENLNTEAGLLVRDEAFARELRAEIERDLRPENSWVIAHRSLPLPLASVNGLIGGLTALTPLDLWPIRNTSSFELRAGASPVPPTDPAFHKNYREVGSFPGTDGLLSPKEILTRLYKAVGSPLTPMY